MNDYIQTWTAVYRRDGQRVFLIALFSDEELAKNYYAPDDGETLARRRVRMKTVPIEAEIFEKDIVEIRLAEAEKLLRDIVLSDSFSENGDKVMMRAIERTRKFLLEGSADK